MSYNIKIKPSVEKWFFNEFSRVNPKQAKKITKFIEDNLATSENPCALPNARKLSGYNDNRWRWTLGNYRIIAKVINGEFKIIQIIEIARRNSTTYSHTKG